MVNIARIIAFIIIESTATFACHYIAKMQSMLSTPSGKLFSFPLFHNMYMALGGCVCYTVYLLFYKQKEDKSISKKTIISLTLIDSIGSLFIAVGLVAVPSSIIILFQSVQLMFTMMLSKIFMHHKYDFSAYTGLGLQLVGSVVIFKSLFDKEKPSISVFIFSIIAISKLLSSIYFVLEEKLVKMEKVHATKTVGLIGLYSVPLNIVMLSALSYIRCSPFTNQGMDFCSEGVIENIVSAVVSHADVFILLCAVIAILSSFLVNWSLVELVNLTSALDNVMISIAKIIAFWILNILIGWDTFDSARMFGIIIQIAGITIYSGVLKAKPKTA